MSFQPRPARPRRLEDEFYRIMSLFSNREWKQFARGQLGLSLPAHLIDDIRSDFSNDIREQKYQMLSLWQRRNGARATTDRLNRIVDDYFERLGQEEQRQPQAAVNRPGNVRMAHDDVESDPEDYEDIRSHGSSVNYHLEQDSLRSRYLHSDIARGLNDNQTRSNNLARLPQPQYLIERGMPNMQNLGTAAPHTNRLPSSIQATSIEHGEESVGEKLEGGNCGSPRTSSETTPKEVRTSSPHTGNGRAPFTTLDALRKAFHPHHHINPNANVKISVIGDNAVGIQTNFYADDYKISMAKQQPETPEKLAEYCTKVTSTKVASSDKQLYNNHLDKSIYIYKISHKPKGAVIIINNSFPNEGDERHGSQFDLEHMNRMWEQLGCNTFIRSDLSAADTLTTLQKFALSSRAYNSDFVTVVIMSHGGLEHGEDVFYSADREAVKVRDVLDTFNNVNARRLQGIPKLFFFQFCRGKTVDKGVDRHLPEDNTEALSDLFNSLEVTVQQASGSNNEDSADALATASDKVPTMSDCLISFATLAGYKAFRNNLNGSWYVNAIVNIFSRHAKDQHVIDLMTMVNAAVKTKTASSRRDEANNGKEMSNFQSTLTKKLFLFPGFPTDELDDDF